PVQVPKQRAAGPRPPEVPPPPPSAPPPVAPPPVVATSHKLPNHVPGVYRWAPARKTPPPAFSAAAAKREPLYARVSGRLPLQRRTIGWAAAAVAAIALVFALTRIGGPAHLAQLTPPNGHQAPASHAPAPPVPGAAVLEPAAPASAGIVRQVQLSPVGACDSGGACNLQTTLDLQLPHDGAITWEIVAVDRCTGAQSVLRSSTSTPDPSWQVVWATDQYSLPSTHPLLLYMVTVSPVRVASPPVAVGAPTACRPAQT
ncbi:MAG: hypothetical protein ACREN2_12705, partial [Candidatus Dormibacteria bacterium]